MKTYQLPEITVITCSDVDIVTASVVVEHIGDVVKYDDIIKNGLFGEGVYDE